MTTPAGGSAGHESAAEAVTSDARTVDGSPHEAASAEAGPRDLVDPEELTVGSADGDSGPREQQKHETE